MNELRFADLFAGLGGLRIGFEQACQDLSINTKCVFTSEIKKGALIALNHNFKSEKIERKDITKCDFLGVSDFDILLAGFPCQAFSQAGLRKGFSDERGTLIFDVFNLLQSHKNTCKGFILENVEGLLRHNKENQKDEYGQTFTLIINTLKEIGYNISFDLYNAANYGCAQNRRRVFIVGIRDDLRQMKLTISKMERVQVKDIMEHNLPLMDNTFTKKVISKYNVETLDNTIFSDKRGGRKTIHSWDLELKGDISPQEKNLMELIFHERRKKKYAQALNVKWSDGMPLTMGQIKSFSPYTNTEQLVYSLEKKNYLKYRSIGTWGNNAPPSSLMGYNIAVGKFSFPISRIVDRYSQTPTLTASDMSRFGIIDGTGIRPLSIKEGLRLFGFPDWYDLSCVNNNVAYDLLGNSVCVPLVRKVAHCLLKTLEGYHQ